MFNVVDDLPAPQVPFTRADYLNAGQSACRTLWRTPAQIIGSITIVTSGTEKPDEARPLVDLARRVAEEYGLAIRVPNHDCPLTICLSRYDGKGSQIDAPGGPERTTSVHLRVPLTGPTPRPGSRRIQGAKPGNQYLRIATRCSRNPTSRGAAPSEVARD